MDIALVVIGWLMGFATPLLTERVSSRKRRIELGYAINIELTELQYLLAIVAMRLRQRNRELTAERVEFLKSVVKAYNGPELDPEKRKTTLEYLELPFAQQQLLMQQSSTKPLGLVKFSVPFITVHLQDLRSMPFDFQWGVAQILRDLELFNGLVEYSNILHARTYDGGITPVNHAITLDNIEGTYRNAAFRAECIIAEIRALPSAPTE